MRVVIITLIFVSSIAGIYYYSETQTPCKKPLKYSIGIVDARHGLDRDEFKALVYSAESIWEEPAGINLFELKENADLKINLIFDEKQLRQNELINTQVQLTDIEAELSSDKTKIDRTQKEYTTLLNEYNREIELWNNGPRTSLRKYNELQKLEQEVNSLGKTLERMVSAYNSSVQNFNSIVAQYNHKAQTEEQAGEARGAQSINIFLLNNKPTDKFLIAHELGHALGIDEHIPNPESLMYYKLPDSIESVSDEDLMLLGTLCVKEF